MKFLKKENKKHFYRGFTLIELMVAISIVAILATVGFSTYSQSQLRARDAKRKQDLRAIATALELYYQLHQHYPCVPNSENGGSGFLKSDNTAGSGGFWIQDKAVSGGPAYCGTHPFTSQFVNQLPKDPVTDGGMPTSKPGSMGYAYFGGSNCGLAYGQFYALATLLENNNDADINSKKIYKWCDGVALSNWSNNAFVLTSQ